MEKTEIINTRKREEDNIVSLLDFRKATDDDVEFIRIAHHEAYHDVLTRQFGPFDESSEDSFIFQQLNDYDGFEIIYFDGVPCGYELMEATSKYIKIWELVLLPEFQNMAIGSSIISKKQKEATEKNIPIRLSVLKASEARRLYARLGFEKTNQTDSEYEMEWTPKK